MPMLRNSLFSRPEESFSEALKDSVEQLNELIVYNDDFNTFDWVIQCFMDICNHSFEQSEQLSLIIHFKGKAVVKTDVLDVLQPMKDALVDRGLSAVIESFQTK
jgi:ATP-dependent Clp protease adaptor protein ClpS